MDDPQLSADLHQSALRGLSRLNWLSFSSRIVWRPIRQLARQLPQARLRVLDIATGGGDIPVSLCLKAQRQAIRLEVTATDISQRAIDMAQQRASEAGVSIDFRVVDILGELDPAWNASFDVVMCSLFLHHLSDDAARVLLERMARLSRSLVLVNDLRRSQAGYLLAHAAARLFTRSPVVHTDGPLSVLAALNADEVRTLAESAGLSGVDVARRWPFRYLMSWRRPSDVGPLPAAGKLGAGAAESGQGGRSS